MVLGMLQDGMAEDRQSTDVTNDGSTVHQNNAVVNETALPTTHNQSSDCDQYVIDSIGCCRVNRIAVFLEDFACRFCNVLRSSR